VAAMMVGVQMSNAQNESSLMLKNIEALASCVTIEDSSGFNYGECCYASSSPCAIMKGTTYYGQFEW
jgi:hypothetical protein